jgi:hypothetical protein
MGWGLHIPESVSNIVAAYCLNHPLADDLVRIPAHSPFYNVFPNQPKRGPGIPAGLFDAPIFARRLRARLEELQLAADAAPPSPAAPEDCADPPSSMAFSQSTSLRALLPSRSRTTSLRCSKRGGLSSLQERVSIHLKVPLQKISDEDGYL